MDPERSLLDELKELDQKIQRVTELGDLKPIFYRLEEIGKTPVSDFEVQLTLADVKQRLVNKGRMLKDMAGAHTSDSWAFPQTGSQKAATPPPPPPPPAEEPTGVRNTGQAPVKTPPPLTTQAAPVVSAPMPPPPSPPAASGGGQLNWKRALWLGGLLGAILAVAGIAALVQLARNKNAKVPPPVAGSVPVEVVTSPAGATIRINNEEKCKANCKVDLAPGNYEVMATLEGYDPAVSGVTVAAGAPITVNLALTPQPQTLRLVTEFQSGKVLMDDQPAGDLQDGTLVIDRVPPGSHNIKITAPTGEASFTVTMAPARAPEVADTLKSRDVLAVLVGSFGSNAKVYTSTGPMKVQLDAKPQGDATPKGLDLQGFAPGVHELVVGEKKMTESFGPSPMLTAFLKSDMNIGTLIVAVDQDDATVFVNDREMRTKTKRGLFRISMPPGAVKVRVAKDGYEAVPAVNAAIKKGEESRLEFKMKSLPQVAKLEIRGGVPGTQVFIDQRSAGVVGADGGFSQSGIAPGDHTVELRREGFRTNSLRRSFRAGDTVALSGSDVVLASANGTLRINKAPADSTITWRRSDEQQTHAVTGAQVELPAGSYVITGRAPSYAERSVNVQVASGETRTVDIQLQRAQASQQPAVKAGTMADFDEAGRWKQEGSVYTSRGGGNKFATYSLTPTRGVFSFNVQKTRGSGAFGTNKKIKWFLGFKDERNHALFELDNKSFVTKEVTNGRSVDKERSSHAEKDGTFSIQIEVQGDRIIHRMKEGEEWTVIGSLSGRNFAEGKFGFVLEGELAISDFRFTPAR